MGSLLLAGLIMASTPGDAEALQKSLMSTYRAYRVGALLSDPSADGAQVNFVPVEQPWLKDTRLFVASGHAEGGHELLSPALLVVRGSEMRIVSPGLLDERSVGQKRWLACHPLWVKQQIDLQRGKGTAAKLRAAEERACIDLTPEMKAAVGPGSDEKTLRPFADFLMLLEDQQPGSHFIDGEAELDSMMKAALHGTHMSGISIQPPAAPVTLSAPRLIRSKGVVSYEGFAVRAGQAEASLSRVTLRADGAGFALKTERVAEWSGHIY